MEAFAAADIYTRIFQLFLVLVAKQVAAIFPLHCLGHGIKYGNPEAGKITQQFLSTTRPYSSIRFIESFLF